MATTEGSKKEDETAPVHRLEDDDATADTALLPRWDSKLQEGKVRAWSYT